MAQTPLLLRGGLTGRVYIVTRYKDLGEGRYESLVKHDVTEQYNVLRAEDVAAASDDLDDDEGCPGHEATACGQYDGPIGETVYCDGTCQSAASR